MSIQIHVPGASFTKKVATLGMPHLDLAQDYFLFGGSVAASVVNQKSGGAAGVSTGSPVVSSGYLTMNGNVNYISSGSTSQGPCTFLTVARQIAGGNYPNVGNYNLGAGTGLMIATSTNTSWSGFLNGSTVGSINDPTDNTNFKLLAVTYDGAHVVIVVVNGSGMNSVSTAATGTLAAAACHWGGLANYGTHDAAMGMTFPSALTITQINDIYQYAKPFLASRGVTML